MHGVVKIVSPLVFKQMLAVPFSGTLLNVVDAFLTALGDTPVTMLSGYRAGDTGPHGSVPCDAVDFESAIFNPKDREFLMTTVNSRYVYDPEQPHINVMVIRDSGRGPHFHLQAGPSTGERAPAPPPPAEVPAVAVLGEGIAQEG